MLGGLSFNDALMRDENRSLATKTDLDAIDHHNWLNQNFTQKFINGLSQLLERAQQDAENLSESGDYSINNLSLLKSKVNKVKVLKQVIAYATTGKLS